MHTSQFLWQGLEWSWSLSFWLVAIATAVGLIILLMQYERRLIPKRVGNALLVLRLVVLTVLLLTLLQPIIARKIDHEHTGRVLVAVDLSESMETADGHAGKGEKLRWARAMGMIGNAATNDRIDRWIKAFDEGRVPKWVDDDETADPALAKTRRENLEGIFSQIDQLPRKEIARRLLTGTSSPLLPQLEDVANVELVVFAGNANSSDKDTLETTVKLPPVTLLTGVSDLSQAMSTRGADSTSSPVVGMVLLTDGRDNSDRDAVVEAARLGQNSTPVFPVIFGSKYRPKDLAIANLDYAPTTFKDDKSLLTATLNTAGYEGEEIEVILEQEGEESVTKTVTPDSTIASVEFDLKTVNVGRHKYTLRMEPRPGETREDNNSKTFAATVTDDTVRALVLEGAARWEFRFINNALERDPRVDVKGVVYRQPYLGILQDTFFPRTLDLPDAADDIADSPFAEPDLVILGDVSPDEIPEVGWQMLEKFVSESGGTLVFIAGKQHFPLAYQSKIVERLLPMTELRPINIDGATAKAPPSERGFHLKLTAEGEDMDVMQFDPDPQQNRDIWAGLAGHTWGLLGEAKPGANVFAYAIQPGEEDNVENERKNAVIVRQHFGSGQVVWLGIDSTWRWRHRVGDKYHHRFWGQLARWSAENKAAAGNEFVRFGPDRSDIEVGDDAVIRAQWTQAFLKKNRDIKARALIHRAVDDASEPPFAEIQLDPIDTRPLIHEARAVSLPPGEYRVTLVVENADVGPDEITAVLYVNEKTTPELSDLSANRELLAQVADVSGGRLFYPDEVGGIAELFRDPNFTSEERLETRLWDHWLVILIFFALLTSEWVVRKLNGLP
ncbi:MAG: hypothetical protein HON53_10275 [Planctomycetaceae bacterium]|jgi:hypothetical protein|nr:hypothetical protein [Planctomycetaceae bacterium]MBT6156687.1 hypothetical protein [Planctomycetaceae bacterium]MBT6486439.1 hypothetical protein [Planctomycetaceae bacterium]MBT6496990.1 hypothetical protein [Planctomycetaceae bacterium]